jgi:hypothetical protein
VTLSASAGVANLGSGWDDAGMSSTIEPLVVIDTGVTESDDGTRYPTAVIDATGRPDVTDLARVHAVEGIGDVATFLELIDPELTDPELTDHVASGPALLLTVRLTRPVIAEFTVRFELPAGLAVLADAAVAGHLLLATTVPDVPPADEAGTDATGTDATGIDATGHPAWLAVDVDGARLAEVLLPIARRHLGDDRA